MPSWEKRFICRKEVVVMMGAPLILVGTMTYAIKSRDILFRRGIKAYVERVPPTDATGCGYGVYVPYGADEAEQILRENNMRILGRAERDEVR